MKIYAKQIAPEYQESPLFMEEWPKNVYVFGNKHFCRHIDVTIENIKNDMYNAADELKALMRGLSCLASFTHILAAFLPAPENKIEYSRADRLKWRALLLNFDAGAISDDEAITAALELITGDEYESATIRGSVQSEWNNIIYPAKYGAEWLRNFEIEYFNMGAEWRISEGSPDNDDCYYFYTHEWSEEGQRAEIADAAGAFPGDVVLYVFDGYINTPSYRMVPA